MDAAITPPLRIQPYNAQQISSQVAHAKLDVFLAEFQARSNSLNGGDATVPAQLFKLRDALNEEQEINKQLLDA